MRQGAERFSSIGRAALLPFDIDEIAVGPWMANPRKTVDGIVRRLGKPFTETSYVAQLTGKHGLIRDEDGRWTGEIGGDVMPVRIVLHHRARHQQRRDGDMARAIARHEVPEIDARLGDAVHIIYLGKPKLVRP